MNFDIKKLGVDEVEIDIKSLIKRCAENWKRILLVGIVCAILFPLMMYVKDGLAVQEQNESSQSELIELSKQDQIVVDEYILLTERKNILETFIEDSVLMNMDSGNAYRIRMDMYVGSNDEKKFDIASTIRNYILNGNIEFEINRDLQEGEKRFSSDLMSIEVREGSGIINIEVFANNEEQGQKYVEVLKSQVENYSESLQKSIGTHSFEIVQTQGQFVSTQDIYDRQKKYLQTYRNLLQEKSSVEATLTEKQKVNITILSDEDIFEKPTEAKINIKYVVLGFCIGLILGVGIVVLFALFGGRVQSEYEIQKRLQIPYLGLAGYEQDEMIISKISAMVSQQNINNIKFISSSEGVDTEKISVVVERLKKNQILCVDVENILKNNDAVEHLSEESNIIIVEKIGQTKVKELYQEALLCKEMQANIVGYLMV